MAIIDMGAYEYGAPVWVGIEGNLPVQKTDELALKIYPNPCQDQVNLQFEIKEAQRVHAGLYSIRGELIRKIIDKENVSGNFETRINLYDIPAGVYFLHVRTEDHISCQKLIVL